MVDMAQPDSHEYRLQATLGALYLADNVTRDTHGRANITRLIQNHLASHTYFSRQRDAGGGASTKRHTAKTFHKQIYNLVSKWRQDYGLALDPGESAISRFFRPGSHAAPTSVL
jgi:hypothetical protein